MAAAAMIKVFGQRCQVSLVESEEIGTIGVGEATVPHLKTFNQVLEIDEVDFVKQVQGTFKLGIQFIDWGKIGDRYIHGFGSIGHDYGFLPFHQYWLRQLHAGKASEIGDYSLNTAAAPAGKFMAPATDVAPNSPLATIAYAYHFDAGRYARYLRVYAEARGVRRIEGKILSAVQRENGFIDAVVLAGGAQIAGDLFIDCSGMRGLLIEQTLKTGYEDWSHWLLCDRAQAVACERVEPPTPYTRSTAREAGWQWRIPLQHRTGNGYVYSSQYISDDAAAATLMANLDGKPLSEPRVIKFLPGKRKQFWHKNCLAMGLAGGFLEPLESTSIYLVQSAIARLINLMPDGEFSSAVIDRYNTQSHFEYDRIRDFLILHYCATKRDDTPFWNYCRNMQIPDRLEATIRLFRDSGRFFRDAEELFALPSWVQVMLGQGIVPRKHHPAADLLGEKEIKELVDSVKMVVSQCVNAMPMHQQFIDRHCKAASV